jgi:predicted dehydrogenase
LEDCVAVQRTAEGYDCVLQYGLELRYSDLYRKVAKLIHGGEIGRLRMLFCKEFRGPMLPGSGGWRGDPERTGGTLLEKNCHHFDLFNWFAGSEPVRVAAMGGSDASPNGQVDNAWVTVEYANGVRACLGLCLFSPFGNDLEVSAIGDEGKLESFAFDQVIQQWAADRPDKALYHVAFDPLFGDVRQEQREKERSILWERSMIYREHRDLIECLRTGRRPLVDAKVALKSSVVPLAAHRALQTGSVVSLGRESGG